MFLLKLMIPIPVPPYFLNKITSSKTKSQIPGILARLLTNQPLLDEDNPPVTPYVVYIVQRSELQGPVTYLRTLFK